MSNFVFISSFIFVYYHQFEEKKEKNKKQRKTPPQKNDLMISYSVLKMMLLSNWKKVKDKFAFKIF